MENNYIKLLTDDLKRIWAGLSMPQKFGLMSMIIVIVALSTFFLVKSLEPDWAVLYTDLNETDAANIIESLKKMVMLTSLQMTKRQSWFILKKKMI